VLNIEVIFEDQDVCVVDKPSGMVVNKSNTTNGNTIQDWFEPRLSKAGDGEFMRKGGVVHRLDKDASGVLILAKNEAAYEGLKQQFLNRETEKVYLVLVHGKMKDKSGVLSTPIERNPNKKMKFFVGEDLSKTAVTFWEVLSQNENYSLLSVKILTGRTHQIRVHMKHLGHPVVSDAIYGFAKTWRQDLDFCPRLFLHATRLILKHPGTGERKTFESPLPELLEEVVRKKLNFNYGK